MDMKFSIDEQKNMTARMLSVINVFELEDILRDITEIGNLNIISYTHANGQDHLELLYSFNGFDGEYSLAAYNLYECSEKIKDKYNKLYPSKPLITLSELGQNLTNIVINTEFEINPTLKEYNDFRLQLEGILNVVLSRMINKEEGNNNG